MNIFEHFGAFWTKKGCKLIKNISKVISRSAIGSQRLTTLSSSRRPMPPLSPQIDRFAGTPVVGRNSAKGSRLATWSASFFLLSPKIGRFSGAPKGLESGAFDFTPPRLSRDFLGNGSVKSETVFGQLLRYSYLTFHKERDRQFKIEYCLKNAYGSSWMYRSNCSLRGGRSSTIISQRISLSIW